MKYFQVLLSLALASVTTGTKYSTDDLEQLLLDIVMNKTNIEDNPEISGLTGKECFAVQPDKPNFMSADLRISEAKCAEYQWIHEQKQIELDNLEKCRYYLIREIKKGTVPEFYFVINIPVIFGGAPAKAGEFPHMGAVGWQSKNSEKPWVFKCGSTLISENFVLTAGHCTRLSMRLATDVADPVPKVIRLGVENIESSAFNVYGDPMDMKIKRIIVHPNYAPPKRYFDIALMELEKKVEFQVNVMPACLWTNHETRYLGDEVALTGWGYTEKGHLSEALQAAYVNILDSSLCERLLLRKRNRHWQGFANHQICAGNLTGGVDTCQGDSGGPMQVKIGQENSTLSLHVVVGVTSFGIKCGKRDAPGVYTRVSSFIDWIENNVWGDLFNKTETPKRRKRQRRRQMRRKRTRTENKTETNFDIK